MSADKNKPKPGIGEAGFFLSAALVMGVALLWFLGQARLFPSNSYLIVAGVTLASVFWTWGPALVLALVAAVLIDLPRHPLGILPGFGPSLGLSELGVLASLLTYSAMLYRFHAAREEAKRNESRPFDLPSTLGEVVLALAVSVVTVTLARWLLPILYIGRTMVPTFQLHPGLLGFLVAAILMGLVSLLWPAVVGALGRWNMNELEAEMILNETAYQGLRGELSLLTKDLDDQEVSLTPKEIGTREPAENRSKRGGTEIDRRP